MIRRRCSCRSLGPPAGFTYPEVVVASAILVLLGVAVFTLDRVALEREEVNSLALGLAAWLETVQRGAQRTTGGCSVTFTPGNALAPGSALASVSGGDSTVASGDCVPESSFLVPALRSGTTFTATAPTTALLFTARGTTTATTDQTITLRPTNGTLTRCVRISATSGLIAVAINNSGTTCSTYDDAF